MNRVVPIELQFRLRQGVKGGFKLARVAAQPADISKAVRAYWGGRRGW